MVDILLYPDESVSIRALSICSHKSRSKICDLSILLAASLSLTAMTSKYAVKQPYTRYADAQARFSGERCGEENLAAPSPVAAVVRRKPVSDLPSS